VIDASGTQQQYRYDCAGRLAQVLDGSGNVLATYSYGAGNQRLMSVEGGVTRYFAWAGGKIISEYEAWGTNALIWKKSYVYLVGRLLATTSGADGTETQFHHPDRLGTRLVTGAGGAVVTEQLSMPFGTMLPFTQTYGGENSYQHPTLSNPSKKRFTSYDRSDATGLHYAKNRFYSSAQGRFTQVDPIGMGGASLSDPQTLNMYAYCGNDPINHVDPDGLFWGAIGRFFKAIGIAIATFFGSGMGGSSGPGFRTPPTFPGSLPGINAAIRSGMGGFRTPPFVSGFLHDSIGVAMAGLDIANAIIFDRLLRLLGGDTFWNRLAAGIALKRLRSGQLEADRRLRNNAACADAFGGLTNARIALGKSQYKYLEAPTVTEDGTGMHFSVNDASTNPDTGAISVNLLGAFIRGGSYLAVDSAGTEHKVPARPYGADGSSYKVSGDEYRAFDLLHEVGHGTTDKSGFEPDRGDNAAGRRNNDRTYNACFKQ